MVRCERDPGQSSEMLYPMEQRGGETWDRDNKQNVIVSPLFTPELTVSVFGQLSAVVTVRHYDCHRSD